LKDYKGRIKLEAIEMYREKKQSKELLKIRQIRQREGMSCRAGKRKVRMGMQHTCKVMSENGNAWRYGGRGGGLGSEGFGE
jgi:hypothetical protein